MCQRKRKIDDGHGEHDLDQGRLQIVDGPMDEVGTVIDGDDLDAGRQARRDLLDLGLDPVDDVEGVLALPHDDDGRDDLALAVEVGDAPPDIRPEHDVPEVLDPDRCAVRRWPKRRCPRSRGRSRVAPAADHVFGPAELDQPAADFGIAPGARPRSPG